jgi:ribonuclease Z
LIIGHYSARYVDVSPLLEEARSVFPDTVAAEEGLTYEVKF